MLQGQMADNLAWNNRVQSLQDDINMYSYIDSRLKELSDQNYNGRITDLNEKSSMYIDLISRDNVQNLTICDKFSSAREKDITEKANMYQALASRINELEKRKPDAPTVPRNIEEIQATADFQLGQVFPTITRGIQISKRNRKLGTLPYISASLLNHGEADFVSVDEKYIYKDCLTVPFIGGENCTFYHDGEFAPSASVAVLQNENFNKYIYVFLIGILNVIMQKYSFGYKASLERLQKQTIPLPITSDGKPDWEFMSDYIKTQSQIVFEEELKRLKSKLDE